MTIYIPGIYTYCTAKCRYFFIFPLVMLPNKTFSFSPLRKGLSFMSAWLFMGLHLLAQKADPDSLKTRLQTEPNDSIKALILNELAWQSKFQNLKESEKYCLQSIDLCTRTAQLQLRSSAYNTLGLVKSESSEYETGIQYLKLSLADKEKTGDKKGMATVRNNIGVAYKNLGQPEQALLYFNEALAAHTELGNLRGQGEVYSNLGVLARNSGDYEKSNEYFLKSLELRQKINDKNGMAIVYNNLNANASDQSNYREGLEYLYKAATLFESLNNKVALVAVYGNIAKLNKELLRYKEALDYCKKAIEIGQATGASQNIIGVYASMGDIYFARKQYAKSIQYYNKGLSYIKDEKGSNKSHLHLGKGVCYMEEKKYDQALPQIKTAIDIARKNNEQKPLARALQKLAKFYVDTKQTDLVKKPLNESIKISKANEYKDILQLCYKTYANYHETLEPGNSTSKDYLEKAGRLKDTIFSQNLAGKFAEMQTRYETEKKETAIQLLQQAKQIDQLKIQEQKNAIRKQQYLLAFSIAGILLLLVAGYFYITHIRLKSRLKQEAAIKATEEKERLRLARDIHDDLGSGLSKINFLSELIAHNKNLGTEYRENAETIAETSKKLVVNMRDLIWALNPENTTLAGLIARIHEYASDYLEDFPAELKLNLPVHIPETRISKDSHRELLMVVKESLNNVVKHSRASLVEIDVRISQQELFLIIKDNGVGIPASYRLGNGLENMKTRIRSIGGLLELVSEAGKGTAVSVNLPMEKLLNTTLVVNP